MPTTTEAEAKQKRVVARLNKKIQEMKEYRKKASDDYMYQVDAAHEFGQKLIAANNELAATLKKLGAQQEIDATLRAHIGLIERERNELLVETQKMGRKLKDIEEGRSLSERSREEIARAVSEMVLYTSGIVWGVFPDEKAGRIMGVIEEKRARVNALCQTPK